ncbi:hypothetical protein K439DRAFT_765514 [Ramaria rubella]|nr:hypothetical protein K439DRAFT_765514 [Ramaria rubella]
MAFTDSDAISRLGALHRQPSLNLCWKVVGSNCSRSDPCENRDLLDVLYPSAPSNFALENEITTLPGRPRRGLASRANLMQIPEAQESSPAH